MKLLGLICVCIILLLPAIVFIASLAWAVRLRLNLERYVNDDIPYIGRSGESDSEDK